MKKYFALLVFLLPFAMSEAKTEKLNPENTLIIELKDGKVVIVVQKDDGSFMTHLPMPHEQKERED